ncbi:MAG TPA: hypothetical protein VMR50_18875 [Myxococcota bacterium]|nr:hypothetical protein [Myxococcota bacterium]
MTRRTFGVVVLALAVAAAARATTLVTAPMPIGAQECWLLNLGKKPITVTFQIASNDGVDAEDPNEVIAPGQSLEIGASDGRVSWCTFSGSFSKKNVRAVGTVGNPVGLASFPAN